MLILKVFLRLYDVGLSGVNGINAVGLDTLRSLPLGLKNAYFDFYAYFFTHGIAQNHYGQIPQATCCCLCWRHWPGCGGSSCCMTVRPPQRRWCWWPCCPPQRNATDVINTGATVALRMAGSLAIVVPFAIAVIDAAPALTERAFSWGWRSARRSVRYCCVGLPCRSTTTRRSC